MVDPQPFGIEKPPLPAVSKPFDIDGGASSSIIELRSGRKVDRISSKAFTQNGLQLQTLDAPFPGDFTRAPLTACHAATRPCSIQPSPVSLRPIGFVCAV